MVHSSNKVLCLLLTFLTSSFFGQDTLLFQQKNHTLSTYKIILGTYPTKIKTVDSINSYVIIDKYSDSVLYTRFLVSQKFAKREAKRLQNEFQQMAKKVKFTKKQKDSLNIVYRDRFYSSVYSIPVEINLSRVKKIKLNYKYYPGREQLIKDLFVVEYLVVGGLVSAILWESAVFGTILGVATLSYTFLLYHVYYKSIYLKKKTCKKQWNLVGSLTN